MPPKIKISLKRKKHLKQNLQEYLIEMSKKALALPEGKKRDMIIKDLVKQIKAFLIKNKRTLKRDIAVKPEKAKDLTKVQPKITSHAEQVLKDRAEQRDKELMERAFMEKQREKQLTTGNFMNRVSGPSHEEKEIARASIPAVPQFYPGRIDDKTQKAMDELRQQLELQKKIVEEQQKEIAKVKADDPVTRALERQRVQLEEANRQQARLEAQLLAIESRPPPPPPPTAPLAISEDESYTRQIMKQVLKRMMFSQPSLVRSSTGPFVEEIEDDEPPKMLEDVADPQIVEKPVLTEQELAMGANPADEPDIEVTIPFDTLLNLPKSKIALSKIVSRLEQAQPDDPKLAQIKLTRDHNKLIDDYLREKIGNKFKSVNSQHILRANIRPLVVKYFKGYLANLADFNKKFPKYAEEYAKSKYKMPVFKMPASAGPPPPQPQLPPQPSPQPPASPVSVVAQEDLPPSPFSKGLLQPESSESEIQDEPISIILNESDTSKKTPKWKRLFVVNLANRAEEIANWKKHHPADATRSDAYIIPKLGKERDRLEKRVEREAKKAGKTNMSTAIAKSTFEELKRRQSGSGAEEEVEVNVAEDGEEKKEEGEEKKDSEEIDRLKQELEELKTEGKRYIDQKLTGYVKAQTPPAFLYWGQKVPDFLLNPERPEGDQEDKEDKKPETKKPEPKKPEPKKPEPKQEETATPEEITKKEGTGIFNNNIKLMVRNKKVSKGGENNPFEEDHYERLLNVLKDTKDKAVDIVANWEKYVQQAYDKQMKPLTWIQKILKVAFSFIPVVGFILQFIPDVAMTVQHLVNAKGLNAAKRELDHLVVKADEEIAKLKSRGRASFNKEVNVDYYHSISERMRRNPDWKPPYDLELYKHLLGKGVSQNTYSKVNFRIRRGSKGTGCPLKCDLCGGTDHSGVDHECARCLAKGDHRARDCRNAPYDTKHRKYYTSGCRLCGSGDHTKSEHKCARCGLIGKHRARYCNSVAVPKVWDGVPVTGGKFMDKKWWACNFGNTTAKIDHGCYRGGEITEGEEAYGYELAKPKEGEDTEFRKEVFNEPIPLHAPPQIRRMLKIYGNATIEDAMLCRKPIQQKWLIKLGNFLTMGSIEKARKELQALHGSVYDDLFHVYVIFKLKMPDGKIVYLKTEKDEKAHYTILSSFAGDAVSQCFHQPPTKVVTLNEAFTRAEKRVGVSSMWEYDLGGKNCQNFSAGLLGSGNGMLTDAGRKFIMQDPKLLVPQFLLKLSKKGTDLANRIKSFFFGKGGVVLEFPPDHPIPRHPNHRSAPNPNPPRQPRTQAHLESRPAREPSRPAPKLRAKLRAVLAPQSEFVELTDTSIKAFPKKTPTKTRDGSGIGKTKPKPKPKPKPKYQLDDSSGDDSYEERCINRMLGLRSDA